MNKISLTGSVFLILCSSLIHLNSFAGVFSRLQCGSDFRKALIGKKLDNGPVVKTEKSNPALKLKNLGGDDADSYFLSYWKICGERYVFLIDQRITKNRDRIRDLIQFPFPSQDESDFLAGTCQYQGKTDVIGSLKKEEGAKELQAMRAWKIDTKQMKFVPIPEGKLTCPAEAAQSNSESGDK